MLTSHQLDSKPKSDVRQLPKKARAPVRLQSFSLTRPDFPPPHRSMPNMQLPAPPDSAHRDEGRVGDDLRHEPDVCATKRCRLCPKPSRARCLWPRCLPRVRTGPLALSHDERTPTRIAMTP